MLTKQYYVYMMANRNNSVIYTGVTKDLQKRAYQHKNKMIEGFTKKYNLTKLVYFEMCEEVTSAIAREKQIKGGSRKRKVDLINSLNPNWEDLGLAEIASLRSL